MKENWKGTGVALITPFRADLSPDLEALSALVEHSISGGLDYLVIMGTTAESATLNREEKGQIARAAAEATGGRVPLVFGIGGNDTLAVAREMRSTDLTDYQAILSVSPYYNRPTQEGIYRHFRHLAEECPLPIIMYNVPSRTGSNMEAKTTLRLARECPGILGIKEASGNMDQVRELLAGAPDDFAVISGDDFNAAEVVLEGGAGVISVLAQALPVPFSDMIRLALAGEHEAAREAWEALRPFCDLIFEEGNPAGIKALLSLLGLSGPNVRLPLIQASDPLTAKLQNALNAFQPLDVKKA